MPLAFPSTSVFPDPSYGFFRDFCLPLVGFPSRTHQDKGKVGEKAKEVGPFVLGTDILHAREVPLTELYELYVSVPFEWGLG